MKQVAGSLGWNHPAFAEPGGSACPEPWHWEWVGDGGNLARDRASAATRSRCCRAPTTAATRPSTDSVASHAHGNFVNRGSAAAKRISWVMVGAAATPNRSGYWMVGADGGVFSFGNAHFYGSTGGDAAQRSRSTRSRRRSPGKGYWLLAWDGGVFSFGDAHFYGSTGAHAPQPAGRRHGARRRAARATGSSRATAASSASATRTSTGRPAPSASNSPIVGMAPTPHAARATGWSRPTAACSRSATRTSTDRSAARASRRPRSRSSRRRPARATGSSWPTGRCSASATPAPEPARASPSRDRVRERRVRVARALGGAERLGAPPLAVGAGADQRRRAAGSATRARAARPSSGRADRRAARALCARSADSGARRLGLIGPQARSGR